MRNKQKIKRPPNTSNGLATKEIDIYRILYSQLTGHHFNSTQ